MNKELNFIFFGGEPLSVPTLQKLHENDLIPKLIVCNPDKPKGRNMKVAPPMTKVWAQKNNIEIFQPATLREPSIIENFKKQKWDFFLVVSYGKIIPKEIIEIPKYGTINIHPSLLPLYRGPSPIIAPILNGDTQTGVTIIKIDQEMDHGPIIAQETTDLTGNEFISDLEKKLAQIGGELLIKTIPSYMSGKIKPREQKHVLATYVNKITKADGEIKLYDDPIKNWRKFRAYYLSPRVFFFENDRRIIITDAVLEKKQFIIKKVLPEGKKEMAFETFRKHHERSNK